MSDTTRPRHWKSEFLSIEVPMRHHREDRLRQHENKPVGLARSRSVEAPPAKRIQTLDGVLSVPEWARADSFAPWERGADQKGVGMPVACSADQALPACCEDPVALASDDPKPVAALNYGNQSNLAALRVPIRDGPITLEDRVRKAAGVASKGDECLPSRIVKFHHARHETARFPI